MTTREELLDYWQERLTESQRAGGQGFAWTDRLRVKLYRFLIAMYGKSDWAGKESDVDNELGRTKHSELMVADLQELNEGKAPRTRAQILKSLQSMQGLSDELAPRGPLQNGLEPDSPIVVAANRKRVKAERLARYLEMEHIPLQLRYSGSLWQIFVRQCDAAKAAALLAVPIAAPPQLESLPTRIKLPPRSRTFFYYALLFGFFAFLFSVMCASQVIDLHKGMGTSADRIAVVGTTAAVLGMLFLICLGFDVKGHYDALSEQELLDKHHV